MPSNLCLSRAEHLVTQASNCPSSEANACGSMPEVAICPAQQEAVNPQNHMPRDLSTASNAEGKSLSNERDLSNIPTANSGCLPVHQGTSQPHRHEETRWLYPSEKMFFNAMKRKAWSFQAPCPSSFTLGACRLGVTYACSNPPYDSYVPGHMEREMQLNVPHWPHEKFQHIHGNLNCYD